MKLPKKENFNEWYDEVLKKAKLIDKRYKIKGLIIHQPWCMLILRGLFNLWESALESDDHLPYLFPSLIREEDFRKQADKIKRFEEEVFFITQAGSKKLRKKLVLRPASETIIYPMFSLWIRSWRDLPFKIYQSVQAWRYESAIKPLLRGREFLRTESHSAFTSLDTAKRQIERDKELAESVFHKLLESLSCF